MGQECRWSLEAPGHSVSHRPCRDGLSPCEAQGTTNLGAISSSEAKGVGDAKNSRKLYGQRGLVTCMARC